MKYTLNKKAAQRGRTYWGRRSYPTLTLGRVLWSSGSYKHRCKLGSAYELDLWD